MSSRTKLKEQQCNWAESLGLEPDARGYLAKVESNLLRPISARTKQAFENGSGSELQDTPSRPAKMKALHSSSALAVNVFDSWVDRDASALQTALGVGEEIVAISFEEQFPTGLTGNPPNLDVALEMASGHIIGVESKFSEWLTPKSKSKAPFKSKYFPDGKGLWEARGLVNSQHLAAVMQDGSRQFRYLDAPQLLKHALGLATQLSTQFSLYYIYFDWPGHESDAHHDEVDQFSELVSAELRFKAITYQQLFRALEITDDVDRKYLSYLRHRYFSNAA